MFEVQICSLDGNLQKGRHGEYRVGEGGRGLAVSMSERSIVQGLHHYRYYYCY